MSRMADAGRRLWAGLFGTWGNTAITLVALAALAWALPPMLRWIVLDATWIGGPEACAARDGACWAFIAAKLRFILFGFYPFAEQWRAAGALALVLLMLGVSAWPRVWSAKLLVAWIAALAVACLLLSGWPGVAAVETSRWGGLPLSLLMSIGALGGAFPLAIALALGRRSELPVVHWLCLSFIELPRGVPLIAVLYAATLVLPLALPPGVSFDTLLSVQIAITLFFSAYLAEIIRAGLQSIPDSQFEATAALGFGPWQALRLVILPQALRAVAPALVTLAIGVLQSTSLVAAVGIFDLLNAARAAASDPAWLGFYDEAFVFAGAVYFALCFAASRYSLWLERRRN